MRRLVITSAFLPLLLLAQISIPGTAQERCYDANREIRCPQKSEPYYGQDAQYQRNAPSYTDNGDGTVRDNITGLTWSKAVESKKVSLEEAQETAKNLTLGGYSDWRVPSIKELYSLMDFRGYTGSSGRDMDKIPSDAVPFIDTKYFDFRYGDTDTERYIDAQWLSSTKYVSLTMDGMETLFGVNFADGRIKGYGYKRKNGGEIRKRFFVRFVRGDTYGQNDFADNGDGTVSDRATGLVWMREDSKKGMAWEEALGFCENLTLAGKSDWRLPDAKELQYIVDYSRSPDTTDSAAIDPVFGTSVITNEAGAKDYPYFWTSTTHLDGPTPGKNAAYLSFGRTIGEMRGRVMDVHGAGAQRSDPKTGSAMLGHGPQGDAVRVENYVRCVRGGDVHIITRTNDVAETENKKIPRGKGSFVQRLDKDNDGKVSKSEFDGPKDAFGRLDKNHDGFLSEDEAPKGPPPQRF